jgi:hypothetical protein
MAGILFTDGRIALVGYGTDKGKIVGIGGKRKEGELPYQTAVRETIEELFELTSSIDVLVTSLSNKLVFDECITRNGYTTFIMSFKVLENIITDVSGCGIPSRVYNSLPTTITQLLFNRNMSLYAELNTLLLIPCSDKLEVATCLLNDLKTFTCTK